jgi:hypothetical protein
MKAAVVLPQNCALPPKTAALCANEQLLKIWLALFIAKIAPPVFALLLEKLQRCHKTCGTPRTTTTCKVADCYMSLSTRLHTVILQQLQH